MNHHLGLASSRLLGLLAACSARRRSPVMTHDSQFAVIYVCHNEALKDAP